MNAPDFPNLRRTISDLAKRGVLDGNLSDALWNAAKTDAGRDPTAAGHRPVVYVCSPYRGEIERNTANAKRYAKEVVAAGYAPVVPHLMLPQFMEDSDPWMECGLALLARCDELWYWGEPTAGMKIEIEEARALEIPVRKML